MKETKVVIEDDLVVCAACGRVIKETESISACNYNDYKNINLCSDCTHKGYKGFVYCNSCDMKSCWVESKVLEHTVRTTDEGQNWICRNILDSSEKYRRCNNCGRWFDIANSSVMSELSIDEGLCYQCYCEEYSTKSLEPENYPDKAKMLIGSAFMCFGEICIHLVEKSNEFYIKVTNLYGYRELVCKVTTFAKFDKSENDIRMRIDFFYTNMSDAKKYYILWLLERNRDVLFEAFEGKYASDNTDEKNTYNRYVKILGAGEWL